jgi:hypothetical protein
MTGHCIESLVGLGLGLAIITRKRQASQLYSGHGFNDSCSHSYSPARGSSGVRLLLLRTEAKGRLPLRCHRPRGSTFASLTPTVALLPPTSTERPAHRLPAAALINQAIRNPNGRANKAVITHHATNENILLRST